MIMRYVHVGPTNLLKLSLLHNVLLSNVPTLADSVLNSEMEVKESVLVYCRIFKQILLKSFGYIFEMNYYYMKAITEN